MDAVRSLSKKAENFRITLAGCSGADERYVPEEIKRYFICEGKLSAEDLSKKLLESDFFLMLLDPKNSDHDEYIKIRSTGSAQLVYGYRRPAIVHKKFAQPYGFDNSNAVVYDREDLADAMYKAITMYQEEYDEKQENLCKLSERIYRESLLNLEKKVKSIISNNHAGPNQPA
jgi:hypothetical protein